MLLNCGIGEDSWERLGLQGDPTSLSKNWLIWEDPDAGKDWRYEEKRTTEDEMVGWHHWLDGHEFWVNSGSWWWTGRLGKLLSVGSQKVRHDWATELNSPTQWLNNSNICICIYMHAHLSIHSSNKIWLWGLPGGPVTKTLHSQCRGCQGSIPGQGTGSHMPKLRSLMSNEDLVQSNKQTNKQTYFKKQTKKSWLCHCKKWAYPRICSMLHGVMAHWTAGSIILREAQTLHPRQGLLNLSIPDIWG